MFLQRASVGKRFLSFSIFERLPAFLGPFLSLLSASLNSGFIVTSLFSFFLLILMSLMITLVPLR